MNVFNQGLMSFIKSSPTAFHAVSTASAALVKAGFARLEECDRWDLKPLSRYYVVRNDSSLVAFVTGNKLDSCVPFRIAGAHTDSPCLKIKPEPEINRHGYFQLGVEVYGGALLNPWFDRDLSLAGRVSYLEVKGGLASTLVDFEKPIATIPSLAIHLDRDVNTNKSVNAQKELPAILMRVSSEEKITFKDLLKQRLLEENPNSDIDRVLDYELSFYDCQAPALVGLQEDFISSARLDNLLSCYVLLQSIIDARPGQPSVIVLNDHEEVGSMSAEGAQGPFLISVLERICSTQENLRRALSGSLLISADNAHGVHPNYADKHDANHGPILNKGPVIKINSNQRYATNSETGAFFRHVCEREKVPYQTFVVRSDMACGSTIGPITASSLGIKTVDVGVPQFAMHSIRELAGAQDAFALYRVVKEVFQTQVLFG
ncbi:MAG: M18 family aminopeptidase [Hahellaceae bacterium]|nr:M18 family aminopeptidase [Hahellaceae bacterium]MCP5211963.1 M18 family aminopeptidase [Hahellaceae bacterium]